MKLDTYPSLTVGRSSLQSMTLEDSIDAGVVELHGGNGLIAISRQRTSHVDRPGLCGVYLLNIIQIAQRSGVVTAVQCSVDVMQL